MIDNVTTRAAYVPNGTANQLWWQNGDKIEVFDETMLQNDTYEFSWKRSTFENNSKDLVKTPAFAFTNDGWCWLSSKIWNTTTDQVIVTYDIWSWANSGVDNEIASSKGNKVKAYDFSIPMWGEATKTDAGVKVSMKYLTGVLRVQMAQLPADWTDIRVTGWKDQATTIPAPMNGTFKAIISEDDEIDENAQLVELTAYDKANPDELGLTSITANGNAIRVDLADWSDEELDYMRANGGYVYIPLIAQNYGALQFWYSTDGGSTWKLYKKTKPVEVKRGTVYRMNVEEFEIAGSDAESLNVLLKQKKDETGAVTVKTTYPTDMKDGKNVIIIPAGMKAESLTLDLKGITGNGYPFEIESEDGKYTGDIVLDLSDGTVSSLSQIFLNLPNSNVTLKGDFGTADLGETGTTQNRLIVNSLTLAPISQDDIDKGFTATQCGNIWPNYESFQGGVEPGIYVEEGTKVNGDIDLDKPNENKDSSVGDTSIKIEGDVTGWVYAKVKDPTYTSAPVNKAKFFSKIPVTVGKKANVNRITTADGDITISDEATIGYRAESEYGNITISDKATAAELKADGKEDGLENSGNVTMSGNTKATTVIANGTVTMSGEATAARVTGGTASSTQVTLDAVVLSDKANVTTTVGTSTYPAGALTISGAAWAQDATIAENGTVDINLEEEGIAIKGDLTTGNGTAITLTQGYLYSITGTTGDGFSVTFGENEGLTAIASITNVSADFKNASTWNGKAIGKDFVDPYAKTNYPITAAQLASMEYSANATLLNDIDLNNQAWTAKEMKWNFDGNGKTIKNLKAEGADKGTGLFATTTTIQVKNLTIDGAEISGTENVGVIAGIATGILYTNKVVIKNATVKGKFYLGGLAGDAQSGASVDGDCNVDGVTFTVVDPNNNPKISDSSNAKAGSVGQFFGSINGATTIAPSWTSTIAPATDGFKANFFVETGTKAYCYYGGTTAVGIYGSGASLTLGSNAQTIDGTTKFTDKTAVPANTVGYYLLLSAW
jgi:hypothetical protein